MKYLVSICNKQKAAGLDEPDCFLYEIDEARMDAPVPVYLNDGRIQSPEGITGLTYYKKGYIGVVQSDTPQAVFFDKTYRVENVLDLKLAVDAHSVLVWNDRIYIASTGNDSIVVLDENLNEAFFWRMNRKDKDTVHLNSIVVHNEKMLATAFGKKSDKSWRSASQGYLVEVPSDEKVLSGLYHPHSALSHNGGVLLCESFKMVIMDSNGEKHATGRGYARGLAVSGDRMIVGCSQGRDYSRSTGLAVEKDESNADLSIHPCEVLVYKWNTKDLSSCELTGSIPFGGRAREIYDILSVHPKD